MRFYQRYQEISAVVSSNCGEKIDIELNQKIDQVLMYYAGCRSRYDEYVNIDLYIVASIIISCKSAIFKSSINFLDSFSLIFYCTFAEQTSNGGHYTRIS